MNDVQGVPNLGPPKAEAPLAWCKRTEEGMGLIRIHWARESNVTACGLLNLDTSPYIAPGYSPLHVAYATNAAGIAAAVAGVVYANKTDRSSSLCKLCHRASAAFTALCEGELGSR